MTTELNVTISDEITILSTSEVGPAGPQGVQGAQGSQGSQGAQGAQGFQGVPGPIGSTGPTGNTGPQGSTGATGAQGLQGAQGYQGYQGAQGAQGFQGAQGPQGFQGATGFTGSQGAQGSQGPQGVQGAQGPQGPQGVGDAVVGSTNTFTTNQIIQGTTTAALLRITQLGTGNALLVEDSTNPDSTPFVVNTSGSVGVGVTSPLASLHILAGTATGVSPGAGGRMFIDGDNANMWIDIAGSTTSEVGLRFGDSGGILRGQVRYSNTSDSLDFTTAGSERMRIDSTGQVGIGAAGSTGYTLRVAKNITGAVTAGMIVANGEIQSDVTTTAHNFQSLPSIANAVFTLGSLNHFTAGQGTKGASATLTNQIGFFVASSLTGATNNYGFSSNIAAATGAWNLYMGGTANNYMAGRLGVGATLTTGAMAQVVNTTAADDVLILKGAASQTGTFLDVQTSAGVTIFSVTDIGNVNVGANIGTTDSTVQIGTGRTGNGYAYVDLVGDATYSDYGLRIIRNNNGANANTELAHRGTGSFGFVSQEAAPIIFSTTNTERMRIDSSGRIGINGASAGTMVLITSNTAANPVLVVRGAASQTGDLQSWQNSSATALAKIDASGNLTANTVSTPVAAVATPITAATHTVGTADTFVVYNTTATCTVTLPAPASFTGRVLYLKTIAAFAINSASSNVKPIGSNTAGTAILTATAGKFATLVSDGTNWVIMASN